MENIKKKKDTKFKKGEINNPNGRPKGTVSIVTAIKQKLEERPNGMKDKTYLQLLLQRIFQKAIQEGDVHMIRDIINRVDGLPKESIDMTTMGERFGVNFYLPKKNEK